MSRHIHCLDGIRGGLALWVLGGHTAHAVGFHPPVLGSPALAVDLFMLLSGFLMAWHWRLEEARGIPFRTRLKAFYVRRFFRIAPLYYLLLVVALLLAPAFFEAQESMHRIHPYPWMAGVGESPPPKGPLLTFENLLVHFTFIFGAIPTYAANNPLPDWSIGLEMQFYLIFPLLFLFVRRSRVVFLAIAALALVTINAQLFGLYLEPGRYGTFPQPALILFKLHVFVAGMALGHLASLRDSNAGFSWLHAVAFVLPLLFLHKIVILAAVGIAVLILVDWKPTNLVRDLLGTRVFKFFGDISYGIYLVHTLPLYFVLHALQQLGAFDGLSPVLRLALALAVLSPLVIGAAWILHRFVEIPGINLGRRLTRRWHRDRSAQASGTPALALGAKVPGN